MGDRCPESGSVGVELMDQTLRFRRVRELFEQAAALEGADRAAFLDRACAGDAPLRAEVEQLLGFDQEPEAATRDSRAPFFLDLPAVLAMAGQHPGEPELPERIGPYRIEGLLGRGGMGTVYRAVDEELGRAVALKVLAADLATESQRLRFEQEARAIARLQHPGIAHLYHAGLVRSERGALPYFTMELLEGRHLDEHAREAGLDLRQRVALLARIGDAVHHAHQRGIIHRDLKPANIMVLADGSPKVLDFGVSVRAAARVGAAEAAGAEASEARSAAGSRLVGTLAYMSPEQAAADEAELDVRSDVYALGVVGFELLSGRLPYEGELRRPTEALAAVRRGAGLSLEQALPGAPADLTAVFARALAAAEDQRYASVSAFAAELRRFLAREPVQAHPATAGYLLRCFAARRRGLVAAVVVALGLLLTAVVGTSLGLLRARAAESDLQAASGFLSETLRRPSPFAEDPALTMEQLLGWADAELERRFADRPQVRVELQGPLAMAWLERGHPERAERLLRAALDDAALAPARSAGSELPRQAELEHALGRALTELDRYPEAQAQLDRARQAAAAALGHAHPEVLEIRNSEGQLRSKAGQPELAEASFREVAAAQAAALGAGHPAVQETRVSLAHALYAQGELEESERILREILAYRREHDGAGHARSLSAMNNLAVVLGDAGQLVEAEQLLRDLVRAMTELAGAEHPETLTILDNHALLLGDLGREEEALAMLRDCHARCLSKLGQDRLQTAITGNHLADLLMRLGRPQEALPIFRQSSASFDRLLGPDAPDSIQLLIGAAVAAWRSGERETGLSQLEEAAERQQRAGLLDGDHLPLTRKTLRRWRADLGAAD